MPTSSRHAKEVDAWFQTYENPKKDVVMRVRDTVLEADPRIRVLPIATVAEANMARPELERIVRMVRVARSASDEAHARQVHRPRR